MSATASEELGRTSSPNDGALGSLSMENESANPAAREGKLAREYDYRRVFLHRGDLHMGTMLQHYLCSATRGQKRQHDNNDDDDESEEVDEGEDAQSDDSFVFARSAARTDTYQVVVSAPPVDEYEREHGVMRNRKAPAVETIDADDEEAIRRELMK